jgi:hypothetical protein
MTTGTASALIGRDLEVEKLTRLIGRARTAGQALVVIGDPGIDKSALSNAGQYEAAYSQLRRLFEPSDPSFHQRE